VEISNSHIGPLPSARKSLSLRQLMHGHDRELELWLGLEPKAVQRQPRADLLFDPSMPLAGKRTSKEVIHTASVFPLRAAADVPRITSRLVSLSATGAHASIGEKAVLSLLRPTEGRARSVPVLQ
jgi:hypothetical protein